MCGAKSSTISNSTVAVPFKGYSLVKKIGSGGFGQVSLLRSEDGQLVAVKQVIDDQSMDVLKNECAIHKAVSDGKHPNIIRLLEITEEGGNLQLFMEYASGGCLADKIEKEAKLGPYLAQHYFRQLVDGLSYMHSLGLVHRDIKPENLLLTSTDVLKIADFGLAVVSRHEGLEQLFEADEGTPEFMAPEIGKGKYRGEPTDVWAAGITLMQLLTGENSWSRASEDSKRYRMWKEWDVESKQPWTLLDFRVNGLLRGMLQEMPKDRFTIKGVANHSWMRQRFRNAKRRTIREERDDENQENFKRAKEN